MNSAWNHFSPFAEHTHRLLGALACGLDGKASIKVTASKNGLTLYIGKAKVARGKDGIALFRSYDAVMERIAAKDYNGAIRLLQK